MKLSQTLMLFLMAIFFNLMLSNASHAATYYMATTGSDSAGDGSIGTPWRTFRYSMTQLNAGDTFYIRGGTYEEGELWFPASGTAGNIITIAAYPGETPHFTQGSSGTNKFLKWTTAKNYITIDGLEISGYEYNGIGVGAGHDIIIKNCYFHDIRATSTGAIYTGANGIETYNVTIENNRFENIGRSGVDRFDHAIYLSKNSYNIVVRSNLIKNSMSGPAIVGSSSAPEAYDVQVYNNIIYNYSGLDRRGIYIGGPGHTGWEIYNNTIHVDASGSPTYADHISVKYGAHATIKNNIFYGSYKSGFGYIYLAYDGVLDQIDFNLYYPNAKDSDDTGVNSFKADPWFLDISAFDYRLKSSSSAIDAGTPVSIVTEDKDGNPRPQGPVHDIGAFEYVAPAQNSDTSAPVITAFSMLSTSTSLTVPILTLTANDDRGVTGYMVSESPASPSAGSSGWLSTAPANHTFSAAGMKTLYAWAKDGAGNVSAGINASTSITLPDSTPPVVMDFSIPSKTSSLMVPISRFIATDDIGVTGYLVRESPALPSAVSPEWSSAPPTNHAFDSAGEKILHAWVKDGAGNVSAERSASVSISVEPDDTIPPTAPYGLTAIEQRGWKVDLSWHAASDNIQVTGYQVFRDGIQIGETTSTNFRDNDSASDTWQTYVVRAIDAAGNLSQSSNAATVFVHKFTGRYKIR